MTSLDPSDAAAPLDAIGPHTVEVGPWRRRLILFQRVAGGYMIFKGLTYWSGLVGIGDGAGVAFKNEALDAQAATVFFAVIDLVAGVALWLGSTWGAMLWLIAAGLQLFADVVVLAPSGFLVLLTIIEILLVAGYVILRFMVHAETDRRR
jgi:fatty acid desaturase